MNPTRVMVFYDGAYFKQGQLFFRYKERRGWFSLPELHNTIEKYVASKAKSPMEVTKVVGAHFYDGRATTNVADGDQLERERDFEMALITAGIVPHYLTLSERPKSTSSSGDIEWQILQKGVDVKMALDVLDFAHENRLDVAVLITGDADFVPLVRKITSLGKQALIAHFDIEPWKDDRGISHRPTYASRGLIDAATFSLNFNTFVKDPDWKTEVRSLFFQPKRMEGKG